MFSYYYIFHLNDIKKKFPLSFGLSYGIDITVGEKKVNFDPVSIFQPMSYHILSKSI